MTGEINDESSFNVTAYHNDPSLLLLLKKVERFFFPKSSLSPLFTRVRRPNSPLHSFCGLSKCEEEAREGE